MGFILLRRKIVYLIAIATVLILILVMQWVSQNQISTNKQYASLINIAGRQRMLSQKISKLAYYKAQHNKDSLLTQAQLWEQMHLYLQSQLPKNQSDSGASLQSMFDEISPHLTQMVAAVEQYHSGKVSEATLQRVVTTHNEPFLKGMDKVVFAWQGEAERSLVTFSWVEFGMAGLSILILLLEYIYIFRPAFDLVSRQNEEIAQKNKALEDKLEDMEFANEQMQSLQHDLQLSLSKLDTANQSLRDEVQNRGQQNKQLENAQKIAGVGYWSWDFDRSVSWSNQTFKIFDIPNNGGDPTMTSLLKVVHPDDKNSFIDKIKQSRRGKSFTYQYRVIDSSGAIRHILALVQVSYDENKEANGVFGVVRDITEEVNNRRVLQEFINNLKTLVIFSSGSPETDHIEKMLTYTILLLDMEMGIITQIVEDNFKVEYVSSINSQFTVKRHTQLHSKDVYCSIPISTGQLHVLDEPVRNQYRLMDQLNVEAYIGVPLVVEGQAIGTIGFYSQNIPSKKLDKYQIDFITLLARIISLMIEKQRYNRTIESMLQNQRNMMHVVAHDIRGPLNRLYGAIQIISGMPEEKQAGIRKMVAREHEAGSKMVDEMLDIFSLEYEQQVEFQKVDMSQFLKQVGQRIYPKATAADLDLQMSIEDGLYANINPDMLERVLDNLLDNAIKFTQHRGSVCLCMCSEHKQLVITVKDNGIGIPADILPYLFKKFDKKMRRPGLRGERSNGLGMSIVKEIIDKHQGELNIKSSPGEGTQVQITLAKV